MNRKSFLKTLFSGSLVAAAEAAKPVVAAPIPVGSRSTRRLEIESGYIKGIWYYEGEKVLPHLPDGTPLELRPEPTNEHDRLAIEVFYQHHKLGYIGREVNHKIYQMLGQNLPIEVELADNGAFGSHTRLLNEEYSTWHYKVYLLLPENY